MSADVDASMEDAGRPKNDTEHNADRKVRFEDNTDNEDTDVDVKGRHFEDDTDNEDADVDVEGRHFDDDTDNEDTDVDGDWVLFSTSKLWSH